jgi:prepilin-type N-terminal cleavage/methylation domain-containing protein
MKSQHGLTLVELLIAMSVTAAILVGIAGVVQVGEEVANHWTKPVRDAATDNQLANWLQQDSHRYLVCRWGSELDFCQPDDLQTQAPTPTVSYFVESSNLMRADSTTGATAVLVRGLQANPDFSVQGCQSANVMTGVIVVTLGQEKIDVAFRAPKGACPR